MTPKCCEKCTRLSKDGSCKTFKNCAGWRAWFKKQWDEIRRRAVEIREHERAKAAGTSSLTGYSTDPTNRERR